MAWCFYCDAPLGELHPGELPAGIRVAYDGQLGRLWQVCPRCRRWTPVPLEDRWEMLEACERLARDRAQLLLATDHLALLATRGGQLVRIGEAPRLEFADWRYSTRLDQFTIGRRSLLERLVANVPEPPAGGNDFHGMPRALPGVWLASPFIQHAALLTAVFMSIPLVDRCPACEGPLFIHPVRFQDVQIRLGDAGPVLLVSCGLCGEVVEVGLAEARPALRMALAITSRHHRRPAQVRAAVLQVDRRGGPTVFLEALARREPTTGELHPAQRLALRLALDEQAEAEALEAAWREAETLTAIMDDELTYVAGFEAFRERVLHDSE